ncbi:type I methionyl aminopeptidase [Propionibacterium australiense]|uniref:Methionine aminopeptidase n=1 Tax=Propionibacterium australiense TaxID=119981 RepID=A0A383S7X7_9ACTN|nr:type I methionyl aminopeptidase [Propionibacterium australiense]RLP07955.1 type I methionyl aminopeptidase [Propionibacterium australiense]RLP08773.1 type I methionyl aminopeptidase [Propionibacterium australiense]SYZ33356.1 methionyl aminopeptidase [Propionibacterium australiense]VEH89741.1 Methionine aminopeptidase 1 [Propionibacterium australiense]
MRARIEVKTPDQIRLMRRAGLVTAEGLEAMAAAARPGVTTGELDRIGREVLARHGARSNFLNYGADWGYPPFPGVACISVNEVVVHGIPGQRVLAEGDIVSIDFGAIVEGWHADAARTVAVGAVDEQSRMLSEVTRQSMWDGIARIRAGARVGDVSHGVESSVASHGRSFGILREYTGHGIGTAMHQPPDVPNVGRPRKGPRIVAGMCLCVEPMVTLGGAEVTELDDEWTVVTRDSSRAAHWENTVAVLPDGLWVLTEPDGGEAELGARGVGFAPLD